MCYVIKQETGHKTPVPLSCLQVVTPKLNYQETGHKTPVLLVVSGIATPRETGHKTPVLLIVVSGIATPRETGHKTQVPLMAACRLSLVAKHLFYKNYRFSSGKVCSVCRQSKELWFEMRNC